MSCVFLHASSAFCQVQVLPYFVHIPNREKIQRLFIIASILIKIFLVFFTLLAKAFFCQLYHKSTIKKIMLTFISFWCSICFVDSCILAKSRASLACPIHKFKFNEMQEKNLYIYLYCLYIHQYIIIFII